MKIGKKRPNSRLREILAVFVKHGITNGIKSITDPSQMRKALEELGPTFIKIGQVLSTRPDMLPDDYIKEFQKLQDSVSIEDFDIMRSIIETELKKPLKELFIYFEKKPVASASVSQVHIAIMPNHDRVAVKIQRPDIREKMMSDINILRRVGKLVDMTFPDNVMHFNDIIDELWNAMDKELDFLHEAENILLFNEMNRDVACITSPKVYVDFTTAKVLTMEYIDGIKITDVQALKESGYDLEDLTTKLVNNYLKQIFEDGYFHGDPHPGNLFVREKKIAYIDFGMMAHLTKGNRQKFSAYLRSLAYKDIHLMTESILRIGKKKKRINRDLLYTDIEDIYYQYIDTSVKDINLSEMMDSIFKTLKTHGISMPKDMVLLLKGLMTIENLIRKITTEVSMMDLVVPYVKADHLKNIDAKQELIQLTEDILISYKSLIQIPSLVNKLITILTDRRLKLQMEHTNLDKPIADLHKMTNRIIFGIVVSAILISSSLIINAQIGPLIYGVSAIGFMGYAFAGILGAWLLLSILRSGKI